MNNTKRQFRPLPVPAVKLGGFWGDRQDAVSQNAASILLDRCQEARMFEQIDPDAPNPGIVLPVLNWTGTPQMFWDSDVAKCIETIAYSIYRAPNAELEARADRIIDMYARLQQPDGYCNSFFIRIWPDKRFTNLRDFHELYCAGHMIEAAVAYFQATGKRKFLDVMCRYADLIDREFGNGPGQRPGYCGHEEIELALVRLARVTGEKRYLDLARYFVEQRGQSPNYFVEEARRDDRDPSGWTANILEYNQSHLPVRQQERVVGHAVRAMYLYCGMADVATEYHDDTLTTALERLWDDVTQQQMYITGGIGPSKHNEGFTSAYDLPNDTAYAETCASVALVFWASRMLGRKPDGRYADVMEQALFNGCVAGLSRDGRTFFYDNPLESAGGHHRWTWHQCPCCPPNIGRLVTSIGSYIYGLADDELAVHLFAESEASFRLAGTDVSITQHTGYPYDGGVQLTVSPATTVHFVLSLRLPAWIEKWSLLLNGQPAAFELVDGYVRLERDWQPGDTLHYELDLAPREVRAHPRVRQDAGRVALMRGPLVYCLEGVDNGSNLHCCRLTGDSAPSVLGWDATLDGAVVLQVPMVRETADVNTLYWQGRPRNEHFSARLIPYHLWDNRDPGEMMVWLRQ